VLKGDGSAMGRRWVGDGSAMGRRWVYPSLKKVFVSLEQKEERNGLVDLPLISGVSYRVCIEYLCALEQEWKREMMGEQKGDVSAMRLRVCTDQKMEGNSDILSENVRDKMVCQNGRKRYIKCKRTFLS